MRAHMRGSRPRLVGHRGASALAPENTLRAIELAIAAGLDLVEVDVHLSRDGELMVIHDADLLRMASRSDAVAALTADELARIDVGAGQSVPRLAEVFALARGRIGVYVELKGERTGAALGALLHTGAAEEVEVIAGSFEVELVAELVGVTREVPRSILFRETSAAAMVDACTSLGATYAHPCFRPLERPLVDELHAAGLLVMAPHTNDRAEARAFAAAGIDVLATDDPAVLTGLRG
jgi:glycerophosphoryl diester phosphodiesterase